MSEYYTPQRVRGLYSPAATEPFKLSRSKIDLFLECPRCFYLDRFLGVGRPPGFPFALNSAVDHLLKLEFDIHRTNGTKHPLIVKYGIDARPIPHDDLDKWRHNFTGIQHVHQLTNFLVFGAIDDLWQNSQGEYIVVDYKSTSKDEEITELNKAWQDGYKRQMEVYQWLLRQNGYKVSDTGYFVYCNGRTDKEAFDAKLEFDITLIAYKGDDSWVEKTLFNIHNCLNNSLIPAANPGCDYCNYVNAVEAKEKEGNLLPVLQSSN
ncbi:PD-(D/E)XK nuclease family protein [Patescibacteria group bacterium]|nr:PD-(D/E)XK nuclease family protein [Patescibacteria group bacterium]